VGARGGEALGGSDAGHGHTCAVASDNQAYCWGYNVNGQLGNGVYYDNSWVPSAVVNNDVLAGKTILSISALASYTCAIASDKQAYCWGWNLYGQLGNYTSNESNIPTAVDTNGVLAGKTILSIGDGEDPTCAIASDKQAYCWSGNNSGELGDGTNDSSNVPVAVDTSGVLGGKTILSISVGSGFACAVASDNQAYCWGRNWFGMLGNNTDDNSNVPVAVDTSGVLNGKTILSISAGSDFTCAIASDKQAYCWGGNFYGVLGNISDAWSLVPVAVDVSGLY